MSEEKKEVTETVAQPVNGEVQKKSKTPRKGLKIAAHLLILRVHPVHEHHVHAHGSTDARDHQHARHTCDHMPRDL